MRRGFKAHAEREALRQRRLLSLTSGAALLARTLTRFYSVLVITPSRVPGLSEEHLQQLLEVDSSGWSAVTITVHGKPAIIHNPTHSSARQESNLVHEMAHLLCKHEPTQLTPLAGTSFVLRGYDADQEAEADCLAGCLKLPREGLVWAARQGMDNEAIAAHFHASVDLVRYRRNITAVDRQLTRARRSFS